jgi:hypothetical protein
MEIFISQIGVILSGVLVFIFSQYILELVINPYVNYIKTKARIINKLKFYSNIICNPLSIEKLDKSDSATKEQIEFYKKVSLEIRNLSCELDEALYTNRLFIRKILLKRDNVEKASELLIGVSNKLFNPPSYLEIQSFAIKNYEDIQRIKQLLNLPDSY